MIPIGFEVEPNRRQLRCFPWHQVAVEVERRFQLKRQTSRQCRDSPILVCEMQHHCYCE